MPRAVPEHSRTRAWPLGLGMMAVLVVCGFWMTDQDLPFGLNRLLSGDAGEQTGDETRGTLTAPAQLPVSAPREAPFLSGQQLPSTAALASARLVRIVDPSGAVLEGARLTLSSADPSAGDPMALTPGLFQLPDLDPKRQLLLTASAPGWGNASSSRLPRVGGELVLTLRKRQLLKGRVLDDHDQPVQGAWVTLRPQPLLPRPSTWPLFNLPYDHSLPVIDPPESTDVVVTSSSGHFELLWKQGSLFVHHPAFKPHKLAPRNVTQKLELHLSAGTTLFGRVAEGDRLPRSVDEIRLRVHDSRNGADVVREHFAHIDPDGSFLLTGLPSGTSTLTLERDETLLLQRRIHLRTDQMNTIDLNTDRWQPIRLELELDPREVTQVSLKPLGHPTSKWVDLEKNASGLWCTAVAWTGKARVKVSRQGLRELELGPLYVTAGESYYLVGLPSGSLHIAVDAETSDFPVYVSVKSLERGMTKSFFSQTVSADSPSLTIPHVAPGTYVVSAPNHTHFGKRMVELRPGHGQVSAWLVDDHVTLTCDVTNAAGEPRANVRIECTVQNALIGKGTTQKEGRVVLRIPRQPGGMLSVQARWPAHAGPKQHLYATAPMTLIPGTSHWFEIVLAR